MCIREELKPSIPLFSLYIIKMSKAEVNQCNRLMEFECRNAAERNEYKNVAKEHL